MKDLGIYKMASVVRLTGLPPALLRAWEKRYHILRPERSPSGHRLYTEDDLRVLYLAKSLADQGRSIGEIALLGREGLLESAASKSTLMKASSWPEKPAKFREPPGPTESVGPGPGRVVEPQLEKCSADIVAAAVAIDSVAIEQALNLAFSLVSAEVVIDKVLEPSAGAIGELWAKGHCSVAGEHLATSIFVHRLQKLIETSRPHMSSAPVVLCACFPDEQHQIGTLILAYYLGLQGARVSHLGASLPFEELEQACEVVRPRVVYLSVTRPALFLTHRPQFIEMLRRLGGKIQFHVGGRGVTGGDPELEALGLTLWPGTRLASGLDNLLLPR